MKRAIAALCVTAAVVGGTEAAAHAAPVHHQATLTIDWDPTYVFGAVDSPAERCWRSRRVQLLEGPQGSREVLGQHRSEPDGLWYVVLESVEAGSYQAKALRKVYHRNGRRHVCDVAKSPVMDVSR